MFAAFPKREGLKVNQSPHPVKWAAQMIQEKHLKPAQSLTLLLLALRSDYETGIVWAGSEKLAQTSNIARRYSRKILRGLEQLALIEAIEWQRDDGSSGANLYILRMPHGSTREYALRKLAERGGKPKEGRGIYRSTGGGLQTPLPGLIDPPRRSQGSTGINSSTQDDLQTPRMVDPEIHPFSGNVSIQGISTEDSSVSLQTPALGPVNDAKAYRSEIEAMVRGLPRLVSIRSIPADVAQQLFEKWVRVEDIESACWVALARSLAKGKTRKIVSFRYFLPAIEEFISKPLPPPVGEFSYAQYCKIKTMEALGLLDAGKFPGQEVSK